LSRSVARALIVTADNGDSARAHQPGRRLWPWRPTVRRRHGLFPRHAWATDPHRPSCRSSSTTFIENW